jgi:hypothetical protein
MGNPPDLASRDALDQALRQTRVSADALNRALNLLSTRYEKLSLNRGSVPVTSPEVAGNVSGRADVKRRESLDMPRAAPSMPEIGRVTEYTEDDSSRSVTDREFTSRHTGVRADARLPPEGTKPPVSRADPRLVVPRVSFTMALLRKMRRLLSSITSYLQSRW